jgi:phosphate transport system permease protein
MAALMEKLYFRRRIRNAVALTLSLVATIFGLFWLVWILWTALFNGISAINGALFTQMTPPPGSDGGLLNAFFGSLVMSGLAILIGAPIGIAAGTYLAEYSRKHVIGETIRFVNDILLSAPSIVLGLFVYTIFVATIGHFSGFAGALALALIVIPVVVRTTDEMLQLVPSAMREAALSLGVPQWKMTLQVLYRAALPGILTGILLALARISGETAPLLFTALNNQYWSTDLSQPLASVPVVIFQYAMSPYDSWHALAWAGAFIVTLFVLVLSLVSRAVILRKKLSND